MRTARPELDALVTWTLATFHTSAFLLVALLFLYSQGVLHQVLQGLSTAVGLALFAALWGLTYATTDQALSGLEDDDAFIGRGLRWGGVNGVLFLWVLVLVQGTALVLAGLRDPLGALLFGLIFLAIGSIVAFGVGALVGLIFANVDLALLALARAMVRRAAQQEM